LVLFFKKELLASLPGENGPPLPKSPDKTLSGATHLPYNHRMKPVLRQAGAIPYRHGAEGLQVLLITSRGTGRWLIPKGNIDKGFTPAQAAEREAYEEAGVKGALSKAPLGNFTSLKRLRNGAIIPVTVEVYALQVEKELKNWPERAERRLKWMPVAQAVNLVQEEGMARLLLRLQEIQQAKA
jgi:8-oxo-dGTP pyrophosphatase MutT (NUDIX family)